MKSITSSFLLLNLLLSNSVYSNGTENDIFDLSFEQLLDINISLATKTEETRSSVPSSITVFNKNHIALLGVSNAYELMNFVPGFQSTRGDWVGAVPKEHTRGIYLDSGNVLVMINGQRLNDPSFGKASVYMPFIPVEMIERVEFIRGPGSALYGSNAFLGVMNVVTTSSRSQFSASLGEHNEFQLGLSINKQLNESFKVFSNISFNSRRGEQYDFGVKDPMKAYFLEFGIQWDKLSASVIHNSTKLNGFINLAGVSEDNQHRSENFAINVAYEWINNSDWQLSSTLNHIRHDIKSSGLILPANINMLVADFFVGPAWATKDTTVKVDAGYSFNPEIHFNFGFEYSEEKQHKAGIFTNYYDFELGETVVSNEFYLGQTRVIDFHPPFESLLASFDSYAAYSQLKYKVTDDFTLFMGARFDEVKNIDSKLSPRLAFIYDLNSHQAVKLQYGESFRTPVGNELYSNDEITIGNSNLKSEYVKTTELVWHSEYEDWQVDVVLFNNELKDFISLTATDQSLTRFKFENLFETTMQGVELNANFNLNENTWLEAGVTHLFDDPITPSFKSFATAALTYQTQDIQLSVNTIWRDEVIVQALNTSTSEDFKQSDYFLIGFTASYSIDSTKSLMLKSQNLLNKQYKVFDPRILNNGIVPTQSRRVLLQFKQSF